MSCDEVRDITPLWHTGELEGEQMASFTSHLAGCAACSRDVEHEAALDSQLRRAVLGEVCDAERTNRAVLERIRLTPWWRRLGWIAVAAALLAALAVGYHLRASAGQRLYADAARDHRAEVLEHKPRKWRSDAAEIGALAEKFGLSSSKPWALAPDGFHLIHVKTCGLEGRPVLHLVYADGEREISFYVRQADATPVSAAFTAIGENRLAYAQGRERSVVVVTTGRPEECRQLARRAATLL
jgi:anti-sigma factor RsiW